MSPVKIKHSFYQGRIQRLLKSLLNTGEVIPKCAINTLDGVKVVGVAWCSEERLTQIEDETKVSMFILLYTSFVTLQSNEVTKN